MTASTPADIVRLAAAHDLALNESSVRVNEMGLDFRVAIARSTRGDSWVLRIPRRSDVMTRAEVEGRLLGLVTPRLSVAVPQWRIQSPDLIAYPLLPGDPGLELDDRGEPVWRVDVSTPAYSRSLGDLLAELHAVDPGDAGDTGIEVRGPAEVRDAWRADIAQVAEHFEIAEQLKARWAAWLADDEYWPEWSVLTHGEIYPGHTLVVDDAITGVLDWTTASVGDPARDFTFHQAVASPSAFDLTVERYVTGGGKVWPHFAQHCAELFSASPVGYGIYALTTGDEQHHAGAAAALNPPA